MNYHILLNRGNVVVDILENEIRYIKLLSANGLTVACAENEGTGVIGSDDNTHYTLIKADMNNNPDAVWIKTIDELPDYIAAQETVFNSAENKFEPRYNLEEVQHMKQEENKKAFATYLASHPLTWIDGKTYGITQEDLSEITLNLNQYQTAVTAGIEAPILEWHAQHEECSPWSVEQLVALSLAITEAVYPVYHLMQQYKTAIYSAETIEEVKEITLNYEEVE